MRIVKEGDKKKVLCSDCGLADATYLIRNVNFSNNSGTVKNILAAVCDQCGEIVSIPKQSTARVKAEYNKIKRSLDVRIPVHYLDILNLASQRIDMNMSESFNKALVRYYLHALSTHRYSQKGLKKLLQTDIAKAKSSKPFSMKVKQRTFDEVQSLMRDQGFRNRTEVLKSIILRINEDLVQSKEPKHLRELQNFAVAFV